MRYKDQTARLLDEINNMLTNMTRQVENNTITTNEALITLKTIMQKLKKADEYVNSN